MQATLKNEEQTFCQVYDIKDGRSMNALVLIKVTENESIF